MRNLYRMKLPHEVILGRGVLEKLPEVIKEYGFSKPLFVVGPFTKQFSPGDYVIVKSSFKEELDEIEVGDSDLLVGIGGGKNLDAAKYLSMKHRIPYALVPTLPSSDGISSPSISLFHKDGRISLLYKPPIFILMDHDVITSSPRKYILSGFGDVVAKYSSLYDWWLGHKRRGEYFGILTFKLLKFAVSHAVSARRFLFSDEGVHMLLESLILCGGGIGIQGSSRPASGSEHLISHAIDILRIKEGKKPLLHGLQTGISTIFTAYLQRRNWRWVKKVFVEAGFPTRLQDVGIDEDLYVDAVLLAPTLRDRYTILNEVPLKRTFILRVLEEVGMV